MRYVLTVGVYLVLCCFSAGAYAGYQAGDVVNDVTFLESNGGTPGNSDTGSTVSNSIYDIIDSGKVMIIEFGATW